MSSYFLYVEDDTDDIALFRDAMYTETKRDNTVYVNNGFELLNYLQQVKTDESYPCLIILDFYLPKVNGMDTLILLKTDDLYRLIPVIVFSSRISQVDKDKCTSLGADIVVKPSGYTNWEEIMTQFRSYLDD
jgi:CheY-like chemotaxis protein